MRRILVYSALALVGIAYAVWRIHFQGADLRLILNPPPAPPATPAALFEPAEIDVLEISFRGAIDYLAEEYDCPIEIDEARFNDNGVDLNQPVTMRLRGITLRSILEHLARELDRDAVTTVRNGSLLITTKADFLSNLTYLETVAYSNPLRAGEVDPIYFSGVYPNWHSTPWKIEDLRAGALVTAPRDVHELFTWLSDEFAAYPVGLSHEPIYPDGPYRPGNRRVRAALAAEIDLDLEGVSVERLAQLIEDQCQIPVLIDWHSIKGDGVRNVRLRGRFRSAPLHAIIRLASAEDLAFAIRDETLVITTPTGSESIEEARVYPAHFLSTRFGTDCSSVIDRVTTHVAPDTWPIGDRQDDCGTWVIFRQVDDRHRQIETFLDEWRRATYAGVPPPRKPTSRQHLEQALSRTVTLFADESLDAFADRLSREFDIGLFVMPSVANRGSNAEISHSQQTGKLGDLLDKCLAGHQLVAIPTDAGLAIEHRDHFRNHGEYRTYRTTLAPHLVDRSTFHNKLITIFAEVWDQPVWMNLVQIEGDFVFTCQLPMQQAPFERLLATLERGVDEPTILAESSDESPGRRRLMAYPLGSIWEALAHVSDAKATDVAELPESDADLANALDIFWPLDFVDANASLPSIAEQLDAELQPLIRLAIPGKPYDGSESFLIVRDMLLVTVSDTERQALEQTLTTLEAALSSPITTEHFRALAPVADLGDGDTGARQLCVYDLRSRSSREQFRISELLDQLWRYPWPTSSSTASLSRSDRPAAVMCHGLLFIVANPNTLAEVESVFAALRDDADCRQAFDWLVEGTDADSALSTPASLPLLEQVLETTDPIQRRLRIHLYESLPKQADEVPLLLKTLQSDIASDDPAVIGMLASRLPADAIDADALVELIYKFARQPWPRPSVEPLLRALATKDIAGANHLLRMLDKPPPPFPNDSIDLNKPDFDPFDPFIAQQLNPFATVPEALNAATKHLLESIATGQQPLDDETLDTLRRIEGRTRAVSKQLDVAGGRLKNGMELGRKLRELGVIDE